VDRSAEGGDTRVGCGLVEGGEERAPPTWRRRAGGEHSVILTSHK